MAAMTGEAAAAGPAPLADVRNLRRKLRRQGLVAMPDRASAAHLRAFGLAVDVIFDIGAGSGTTQLYRAFPEALFVLIDPQATIGAPTSGPDAPTRFERLTTALGAAEGRATLAVPRTAQGPLVDRASLHRPAGPMARRITGFDEIEVPVTTLDAVAAAWPGRVGLNIDTEGHEAAVLRGGTETLSRCDFVIVELSLAERFQDTPRPAEIIALLAAAGLEFRDVLRFTGDGSGGPAPRLIDALFTRWPAPKPETGA